MKKVIIIIVSVIIALVVLGAVLIGAVVVLGGSNIHGHAGKEIVDIIDEVDSLAAQTFNNQFLQYEGENSGSMIKFLIDKIVASNEKNENKVQIKYKGATYESKEEMQSLRLLMITTYKYKVEVDKYDNQGYISVISIKG